MIGLNFYRGSKRFVTIAQATKIIDAVPPTVDLVGVFVDQPEDSVLRIAHRLRLNWIQLHGNETEAAVKRFQRAGFRVIKAFTIDSITDWKQVAMSAADLRLLDNGPGGTGRQFDWTNVPKRLIPNVMLAGGINAQNLLEGLREVRPLVVDVNSGVELSPGIKSKAKLENFFKVVNRARAK
jgi:phosphoribosylanthranilate isomerase